MTRTSRIIGEQIGQTNLLVLPERGLPVVRFALALRQGALADSAGQSGCSRMMVELLQRGTRTRSRSDWNGAFERLGSQLSSTVTSELIVMHGVSLKRNLQATLDLIVEALVEPAFDRTEHVDLQEEVLAQLQSERDDDDALIDVFLRRALYQGHPLQKRPAGEPHELRHLTVDDVHAAHARQWRADDLVVAMCGDISTEEARSATEQLLQRLPAGCGPRPVTPPVATKPGLSILVVDKPERTQTQIAIGCPAACGLDSDVRAFWLGTTAFGGTFTSRLTREVRDIRGWSYFAYAEFDRWRRHRAPLVFRSAPALRDTADCLALQLDLFDDLARGQLDEKAVNFARSYVLNRYPLETACVADLLLPAIRNELLGHAPHELLNESERIAALDASMVRQALQNHLDGRQVTVVLVATAETVVPELTRRFATAHVEVVHYRDGLPNSGERP